MRQRDILLLKQKNKEKRSVASKAVLYITCCLHIQLPLLLFSPVFFGIACPHWNKIGRFGSHFDCFARSELNAADSWFNQN